ncbi:hypothetical protein PISMIDRAFT_14405 [Pisolithus microcarpus 441]|uniref:Uncharacterized protein n=1 Tax=Pisolithus microcarpus 441 TaxID=765257 RepID=A0A0C9Y154_9AGAM|nr:hypothetical protein PISMIDRAFT_14405 [Pisolithus microcarpus 441]
MSQQPQGTSRQTTAAPSRDWTQVPDEELEVLMDDSKGTEWAKEVEKDWRETVKKLRRAEVRRQRAEEAWWCEEEEHRRSEEERLVRERAEQERWAQEERERQRAEEVAKQAASSKGKGRVEELQREGQLVQTARMGSMPIYSPTTGAKLGKMAVLIYRVACDECQQRGEAQECRLGSRGSRGVNKWREEVGWDGRLVGREEEEVDEEVGVDEGSEMSAPRFEAAGSCLVGERELRRRLPPDDEYHRWLLIAQEQQVMAMERQVYVQAMQGQMWPPFPPTMTPRVGVPQGGAALATGAVDERGGSGAREGTKSGGSEWGDSGDERGDEMDDE